MTPVDSVTKYVVPKSDATSLRHHCWLPMVGAKALMSNATIIYIGIVRAQGSGEPVARGISFECRF